MTSERTVVVFPRPMSSAKNVPADRLFGLEGPGDVHHLPRVEGVPAAAREHRVPRVDLQRRTGLGVGGTHGADLGPLGAASHVQKTVIISRQLYHPPYPRRVS